MSSGCGKSRHVSGIPARGGAILNAAVASRIAEDYKVARVCVEALACHKAGFGPGIGIIEPINRAARDKIPRHRNVNKEELVRSAVNVRTRPIDIEHILV